MARRLFGWWALANQVCARLTLPRTDVADSDRQFERLLRESLLWSFGETIAERIRAAWLESKLRAITNRWPSSDPARRPSVIGWMMTVSAATALILQALRPGGLEPLGWAVPVAVALGGVVLSWIANRTARRTGSTKL